LYNGIISGALFRGIALVKNKTAKYFIFNPTFWREESLKKEKFAKTSPHKLTDLIILIKNDLV
jgi:hypothetical protein